MDDSENKIDPVGSSLSLSWGYIHVYDHNIFI